VLDTALSIFGDAAKAWQPRGVAMRILVEAGKQP